MGNVLGLSERLTSFSWWTPGKCSREAAENQEKEVGKIYYHHLHNSSKKLWLIINAVVYMLLGFEGVWTSTVCIKG